MKRLNAIRAACSIVAAKTTGRRYPVAVGWELTHLCNHSCKYCITCNSHKPEISTADKLRIIDELREAGCEVIAFTGGEALLVKDLPALVDRAKAHGIYVMLTSNGGLIPPRLEELRNVDSVQLTLDGPRAVNDAQREAGMYDETVAAAALLRERGIKTTLNCVITKFNVDCIRDTLAEAQSLRLSISFQPVAKNMTALVPPLEKYRAALRFLIAEKLAGNRFLNQSISILRHIADWPDEKAVRCGAGRIYCRIDPEGYVAPCNMIYQDRKTEEYNAVQSGFKAAFRRMELIDCRQCWHHSRLDLNFIYNFDIPTILSVAAHQ